jgi:hypothetical protein
MRIVTYASDHAPAGEKWLARIRIMAKHLGQWKKGPKIPSRPFQKRNTI